MPEFVPSGYLSIHEALNRLGRELFPSAWTGEEHKARRGLISEEEWSRIKDLPPARGGGAGIEIPRTKRAPATKAAPHTSGDPSDPLYQEEGQAPIPGSRNTGKLLVKRFAEANEPKKPLPKAKIR